MNKHNCMKISRKIILILTLAFALLLEFFMTGQAVKALTVTDTSSYSKINVADYSNVDTLTIYNYLYYSNENNSGETLGSNGFKLVGDTTHLNIFVGDYQVAGNSHTNLNAIDIALALDGFKASDDSVITLNKVFNGHNSISVVADNNASSISKLVIQPEADIALMVQTDLVINEMIINSDAKVAIQVASGATLSVNNLSGQGTVNILNDYGSIVLGDTNINTLTANGANIIINNSFQVETLELVNTAIDGSSSARLTATKEINIQGGEITNFDLFGVSSDTVGNVTINLSDSAVIKYVNTFGVENNAINAFVKVNGSDTVTTFLHSNYVSDFDITFMSNAEEVASNTLGYRASYDGSSCQILGLITTDSGFSNNTLLPEHLVNGYDYQGWYIDDSNAAIFDLVDLALTNPQNLVLNVLMEAHDVVVTIDHGFIPDMYSHLCSEVCTDDTKQYFYAYETNIKIGDWINLGYTCSRFGYQQVGWRITTAQTEKFINLSSATEYLVNYDDVKVIDEINYINIQAVWEIKSYSFRLSFQGSSVPIENIEISFDAGLTYTLLTNITSHADYNTFFTWENTDKYITFKSHINYNSSFAEFFAGIGYSLPILRDNRSNDIAYGFLNWRTIVGTKLSESSVFAYSEVGILDNIRDDMTLNDYALQLERIPFTFQTEWGTLEFTTTLPDIDGINVYINFNGENILQVPGSTVKIPAGSEIILSTHFEAYTEISRILITDENGERYFLQEQAYQAGEQYVNFTLSMPRVNLNVKYTSIEEDKNNYFNIAESSIEFTENITYNGITTKGFWYNYLSEIYTPIFAVVDGAYKSVASLTQTDIVTNYYYAWNTSSFYVTSYNVETKNQLTLIDQYHNGTTTLAISLYFKECKLIARDAYVNNAIGYEFFGKSFERIGATNSVYNYLPDNFYDVANVVIRNDIHNSYTVNFFFIGENTINAITQSMINTEAAYETYVRMYGYGEDASILNLSFMFGNIIYSADDLRINGIDDQFYMMYLLSASTLQRASLTLRHSTLDAKTKRVSIPLGGAYVYSDSTMLVKSVFIGYWTYLNTNSYVHIYGNYDGQYFGFDMKGNSSAIVDGNLHTYGTWYENNQRINTNGYLIVRGNYMRAAQLTLIKGTIIANTVIIDFYADITGGRIITNQLINCPFDLSNSYVGSRSAECDMMPFITKKATRERSERLYKFSNVEIYLFGYYETRTSGGKTYYDHDGEWDKTANPMTKWLDYCIGSNGELKADFTISKTELINDIETQALRYSSPRECIAFGNSDEDLGNGSVNITRIEISGATAWYAASNLTFFNETTIKDKATLVVYGDLRSNRDLIIEGNANVAAKKIYNAWDLCSIESDNTARWQQIVIHGGTIQTDMLGNEGTTRSGIVIDGMPTITNWIDSEESVIQIRIDVRINYLYDQDEYQIEHHYDFDNICIVGIWNNGLANMQTELKHFTTVTAADGLGAMWLLGSIDGEVVSQVNTLAILDNESLTIAYMLPKISLFAVKTLYNIAVQADGTNQIMNVSSNGENVYLDDVMRISRTNQVSITLNDPAMLYKTVIWYYDATKTIYNVIPTFDEANNAISFTMPAANVELYIMEEMELDLYQSSITLTNDGFILAEASPTTMTSISETAKFIYKGNIRISQSNISSLKISNKNLSLVSYSDLTYTLNSGYSSPETHNRIIFYENNDFNRTVTLTRVYQQLNANIYGVFAYNGADIDLIIDEAVAISSIGTDSDNKNTAVTITGYQDNHISKDTTLADIKTGKDAIFLDSYARQYNSPCIKAFEINLSNIVILKMQSGHFFEYQQANGFLNLQNVYSTASLYNYVLFSVGFKTININDCSFDFSSAVSNSHALFANANEVNFNDSRLTYTFGGTVLAGIPFGKVSVALNLNNSDITLTRRATDGDESYYEAPVTANNSPALVNLTGNSRLVSNYRLHLLKLAMYDDSSIYISKTPTSNVDAESFILCKDINLYDNAMIEADYVLISGFAEGGLSDKSSVDNFRQNVEANRDIISTGSLTMNGGTIIANKFIGGAYYPQINIHGGKIETPVLGSTLSIYGIVGILSTINEHFVHEYPNATNTASAQAIINISGGVVNIGQNGYLGGYNSDITISSGVVNLANNAVMGITDEQVQNAIIDSSSQGKNPNDLINPIITICKDEVLNTCPIINGEEAIINTTYGTTTISGSNTAIKLLKLLAENGEINLSEAQGAYDITELTDFNNPPSVGIFIVETLSGQEINIDNRAIVYADVTTAIIGKDMVGGLNIGGVLADTRLYTNYYGASGEGADDTSINVNETGENKNIYSKILIVMVHYHLNDDEMDRAVNHLYNEDTYEQYSYLENDNKIFLYEPTRHGFDFVGWYLDNTYQIQVSSIDTTNPNPVNLYAKWQPKKIKFSIEIDEAAGLNDIARATQTKVDAFEGSYSAVDDIFTYAAVYEISYRDKVLGNGGIILDDLNLEAYQILNLAIKDSRYSGNKTIDYETVVSKAIFDAFDADIDTPLVLNVVGIQKTRADIIFYLYSSSFFTPDNASFIAGVTDDHTKNYYRSSWVDYGNTLGNGSGFITEFGLIAATAPGYSFLGWYADGVVYTQELADVIIARDTATEYYAVWQAKAYQITFAAESVDGDGLLTYGNVLPTANATSEISGVIYYDQMIYGNINYFDPSAIDFHDLPTGWLNGYKFLGFEVNGQVVDNTSVINLTQFPNLVEANGDIASNALTIVAIFEKVKVTYINNLGVWTDEDLITSPNYVGVDEDDNRIYSYDYDQSLEGYTKNSLVSSEYNRYSVIGNYAINSTESSYFKTNGYVESDYRLIINRAGYTFYGWFTTAEDALNASNSDGTYINNALASTPQYDHVIVYAAWHANSYYLVLNANTGNESDYQYTKFYNDYTDDGFTVSDGKHIPEVKVVVDHLLENETGMVEIEEWPDNAQEVDKWYAYNGEMSVKPTQEENKRFLLGFTFAPLNPGTSNTQDSSYAAGRELYELYAAEVTQLINNQVLLVKGQSSFFIPATYTFDNMLDITSIADYPEGSKIQMYAVYRERSIVFIESYRDISGSLQEVELAAYPYKDYIAFPQEYTVPKKISDAGYSLVGWYFHKPTVDSSRLYPNTEAEYLKPGYVEKLKVDAEALGSFDIRVYTVFAAKVTQSGFTLYANASPTTLGVVDSINYVLPPSMQKGQLKYSVITDNIKFISVTDLANNLYTTDLTSVGGDSSNNTIAVRLTFTSQDRSIIKSYDITNAGATITDVTLEAGWEIKLELFTSKVMQYDVTDLAFDIVFEFTTEGITDQSVTLKDIGVDMTPSIYTIRYDANLPEDSSKLTITNGELYSDSEGVYEVDLAYGANLLDVVPSLVGYTNKGSWIDISNNVSIALGNPFLFTVDESYNGIINLKTTWDINWYKLNISQEVLQHWDIKYENPTLNDLIISGGDKTYTAVSAVDDVIPYHATVIFTRKANDTSYAEFVEVSWLQAETIKAQETLNLINEQRFVLENYDLAIDYVTVKILYLEDGSINIYQSKYYQNAEIVWHGSYHILMDKDNNIDNSSTTNTLTLNEDLHDRTINLGNLSIINDNSIVCSTDAKVELLVELNGSASVLDIKNIFIPYYAELKLSADIEGSIINLAPSISYAGIGGSSSNYLNGLINIDNLSINLTLDAGSNAAGVGSGKLKGSGASMDINISNSELNFKQNSTSASRYSGSWIGGESCNYINLDNVSIYQMTDSSRPYDSYAIYGVDINFSNVNFGSETKCINSPIYALNSLDLTDSSVYIEVLSQITNYPFGSDNLININESVVEVIRSAGSWKDYDLNYLYNGILYINDAESIVTIDGYRLIEVNNGNLVLDDFGYTQGGSTHNFNGNYRLIEYMQTKNVDIIINSDSFIYLDNRCDDITLNNITYSGNLNFIGNDNVILEINNLSGIGNLVLDNMMINALGNIGSNGAVSSAEIAVVKVVNSKINASNLGALGTFNETFIMVDIDQTSLDQLEAVLIEDHYRIKYEIDENYNVDHLDKVFRTSQEYHISTSDGVEISIGSPIPGNPTPLGNFLLWYYKINDESYALANSSVSGFDGYGQLESNLLYTANQIANADGTVSIIIYTNTQVTGSVAIKEARVFTAFSSETTSITIPTNGVFSVYMELKGANVTGGSYVISFSEKITANVRITLIVLHNSIAEYYYYVTDGSETQLNLNDFVKMGGDTNPQLPDNNLMSTTHIDQLLLNFDFQNSVELVTKATAKIQFVVGDRKDEVVDFAFETTALNNGSLTIDIENDLLDVKFPENSIYINKQYALVAEFNDIETLPYDAKMFINDIEGTLFDGNKFIFPINDEGQYQYVISNYYDHFSLTFSLTLREDCLNVLGISLIDAQVDDYTSANETYYFNFERILSTTESDKIELGKASSLLFTYDTNVEKNNYIVSLEKQVDTLSNFVDAIDYNVEIMMNSKTFVVNLNDALTKGVYRIKVTINTSLDSEYIKNEYLYYYFYIE